MREFYDIQSGCIIPDLNTEGGEIKSDLVNSMAVENTPAVAKIETIKTDVVKTGRELGIQKDTAETVVREAVMELQNAELEGQAIKTEKVKAEETKQKAEAIKEGGIA